MLTRRRRSDSPICPIVGPQVVPTKSNNLNAPSRRTFNTTHRNLIDDLNEFHLDFTKMRFSHYNSDISP